MNDVQAFPVARTFAKSGDHHNTIAIRRRGRIAFILYSEGERNVYRNREFRVKHGGLTFQGCTDSQGKYERSPVFAGEYELTVGKGTFVVPTVDEAEDPHPVHVPNFCLDDVDKSWTGPHPRELRELPEEELD